MSRETDLSRAVADFLQLMQNAGKVIWHDRLNSGKVCVRKKYRQPSGGTAIYDRFMHLCKNGTPDRYAILFNGHILWIEIKRPGGVVEPKQMEFKDMVSSLPGHYHIIVKYVNDIRKFFDERCWERASV